MKRFKIALMLLMLTSCAAIDRSCSSCLATNIGADWIVVELAEVDGTPYRCWELRGVSVVSEQGSDGIYWKNNQGNLVHVAGSYDYVQVKNNRWDDAFAQINMTREACATVHSMVYNPATSKYELPKAVYSGRGNGGED